MTLLEDINDRGTTVVVATHAHDIVDDMGKRIIALKNGELVRDLAVRNQEWSGYGREQEDVYDDEYEEEYEEFEEEYQENYDEEITNDNFTEDDYKNEA